MGMILDVGSKVVGGLTKFKPAKKLAQEFNKNPEKLLATTTIASIVIKDGIGCYRYVNASLKNDKIPEEKRKFIAALDFTNGILMITTQIALFFIMRRFSEPLFNKLFKKSFNPKTKELVIGQYRMLQKMMGCSVTREAKLSKIFDNLKNNALNTFKFLVNIIAATIVGKRIIVPLISPSIANIVKGKMENKSEKTPPTKSVQSTFVNKLPIKNGNQVQNLSSTNLLSKYI